MKINEFLSEELKTLAVQEMKYVLTEQEQKNLIEIFNSFSPEDLEVSLFEELINNPSSLKLKNFHILLQELNKDEHELDKLEKKLKENPHSRVYPLLWIYGMAESFRNDEFLDAEYAEFLRTVAVNYNYLVNLDDFLYSTGILLLKPQNERWDPEIFLPPLDLAHQKYPYKYAFTKLLAEVHFKNKDYEKALSLIEAMLSSVIDKSRYSEDKLIGDREFPYPDYLEAVQLAGIIHYKLGNFEQARIQLDDVINNLPVIYSDDYQEEDVMSYLDGFLTRMSLYLKDGQTIDAVKKFEIIKRYYPLRKDLEEDSLEFIFRKDLEHDYPEVFDFLVNQKILEI